MYRVVFNSFVMKYLVGGTPTRSGGSANDKLLFLNDGYGSGVFPVDESIKF